LVSFGMRRRFHLLQGPRLRLTLEALWKQEGENSGANLRNTEWV
jgi:hypothetical protein